MIDGTHGVSTSTSSITCRSAVAAWYSCRSSSASSSAGVERSITSGSSGAPHPAIQSPAAVPTGIATASPIPAATSPLGRRRRGRAGATSAGRSCRKVGTREPFANRGRDWRRGRRSSERTDVDPYSAVPARLRDAPCGKRPWPDVVLCPPGWAEHYVPQVQVCTGAGSPGTAGRARVAVVNGAQALIRTLVGAGVDVCFANPGTSEMHFVAALDDVPDMRAVLTLFEGTATGAADAYARMTGRPAAVLLHLGPGLGNGLANLHNARRSGAHVVLVVGDHARSHKRLDAPLESDIDAVAGTFSGWVRRSLAPADVAGDAVEAVAAASSAPGSISTLILPPGVSGGGGGGAAAEIAVRPAPLVPPSVIDDVAKVLSLGEPTVLF